MLFSPRGISYTPFPQEKYILCLKNCSFCLLENRQNLFRGPQFLLSPKDCPAAAIKGFKDPRDVDGFRVIVRRKGCGFHVCPLVVPQL